MTAKGREILNRCFDARLKELESLNEDGSLSEEIRGVKSLKDLNESGIL